MKKYLLSLLISFLSALTLSAAINYEFRFRHLTVENGLSSNGIRAIVQDKHGYIWFGTDEGLNRYDGKKSRSFKKAPRCKGKAKGSGRCYKTFGSYVCFGFCDSRS